MEGVLAKVKNDLWLLARTALENYMTPQRPEARVQYKQTTSLGCEGRRESGRPNKNVNMLMVDCKRDAKVDMDQISRIKDQRPAGPISSRRESLTQSSKSRELDPASTDITKIENADVRRHKQLI